MRYGRQPDPHFNRPDTPAPELDRRRTEIATLNGGIVRAGREQGVPIPVNEAIVDLMFGLEHSWIL